MSKWPQFYLELNAQDRVILFVPRPAPIIMHPSAAHRVRQELAVAPGRVEKLPKEPQTWKTTRRVGKSFANGWRFRRTSDRQQIWPRPDLPSVACPSEATDGRSGRG